MPRSEYERLSEGEKGAVGILTEAGQLLSSSLKAAQQGRCGEAQRHLLRADHLWRTVESWNILHGSRTSRVTGGIYKMSAAERRVQKRVGKMCSRMQTLLEGR